MRYTEDTQVPVSIGRGSSSVSAEIRARVVRAIYSKGNFLPPVRDLSREFGVSSGTVCRALKALASEGLVAARPRHGYEVIYRGPASAQGTPIALVLRMRDDQGKFQGISQLMLTHVQEAATQRGWSLLSIDYAERSVEQIVGEMKAAKIWGAIVDSYNPEIVRLARQAGITVVAMDAWHPDLGVDAVVQDDFHGGLLAAQYLTARGHGRFAWFGQTTETEHAISRFGGALAGLRRQKGKAWPDLVIETEAVHAADQVRAALSRPDRPTGLLALWREQALGVLQVAGELGLKLGRDFDLVGWCAQEQYESHVLALLDDGDVPPMVVWDMETMTRTAAVRLAERHAGPDLPPMRITIETRLRMPGEKGKAET